MPSRNYRENRQTLAPVRRLGLWNWSVMHFVDKHTAAGYREIPAPGLKNNISTVNPLSTTPGDLFISNIWGGGGLNRDGGLIRDGGPI